MADIDVRLSNANFRKAVMESLNLKINQEFYLKIHKEKTTHQYKKLPKIGYIGIRDFDMGACFLVRFKFLKDTYELSSDCGYMTELNYEKAFTGILTGEYDIVNQSELIKDLSKRFYIQILDNISIYEIDYEADEAAAAEELDKEIEKEIEKYVDEEGDEVILDPSDYSADYEYEDYDNDDLLDIEFTCVIPG